MDFWTPPRFLSLAAPYSASPKRVGFAKGGFCHHDFVDVSVVQVRMRHNQGHRVSFQLL